jgi:hypothetical protein
MTLLLEQDEPERRKAVQPTHDAAPWPDQAQQTSRTTLLWLLVLAAVLPLLVSAGGAFAGLVLTALLAFVVWVRADLRQERTWGILVGLVFIENLLFALPYFGITPFGWLAS